MKSVILFLKKVFFIEFLMIFATFAKRMKIGILIIIN